MLKRGLGSESGESLRQGTISRTMRSRTATCYDMEPLLVWFSMAAYMVSVSVGAISIAKMIRMFHIMLTISRY